MKQLWIINTCNADVFLHDLGIVVPAGKHFNIYDMNHDLTSEQVNRSWERGSIARAESGKRIRVNESRPRFAGMPRIKEYKKPWRARMRVAAKVEEVEPPDVLFNEEVEAHAEKIAAMLAGETDET